MASWRRGAPRLKHRKVVPVTFSMLQYWHCTLVEVFSSSSKFPFGGPRIPACIFPLVHFPQLEVFLLRVGLVVIRVAYTFWHPSFSKAFLPCCFHLGYGRRPHCSFPNSCNGQVLQLRSLDAPVDGLADRVPVFVHKWWSPSFTTLVVSIKVRTIPASPARSVNSPTPPRMVASGNISLLNLGLTTLIASEVFSRSPNFTASWVSTSMNLLGSFLISNLLCACNTSKIVSTDRHRQLANWHHFLCTQEIIACSLRGARLEWRFVWSLRVKTRGAAAPRGGQESEKDSLDSAGRSLNRLK